MSGHCCKLVKVAVSGAALNYDRLYSYLIPNEICADDLPGRRAVVPFGNGNKKRVALIMEVDDYQPDMKLKPICSLVDDEPVVGEEMLKMVAYLKETTLCTFFDALRTIIPAGLGVNILQRYHLTGNFPEELTEDELSLTELLKAARTQREFDELLSTSENKAKAKTVKSLLEKGVIEETPDVKRRIRDETVRMLRLSDEYLKGEKVYNFSPKQKSVIRLLEENGAASFKEICYICSVTMTVITNIIKSGAAEEYEYETLRTPESMTDEHKSIDELILSEEQQTVYMQMCDYIKSENPECTLLHGVTGSGKTSVYVKLIDYTLKIGKTSILLIPEISLTPQVVSIFQSYFGDTVAIMHSNLSLSQRLDEYKRIRRGDVKIVIGTRSAIFAPLENIGLIIIDEEGERTYKSEQSPKYHARDIAKLRCVTHKAAILLSSATPSIESYYNAKIGRYHLLELNHRYSDAPLPEVSIVDMSYEDDGSGSVIFSSALREEIAENLEKGEQTILLLNRRGYHTYISCMDCRSPVNCPNCSIPMTYHKVNNRLICHYCGYSQDMIRNCPVCHSEHLFRSGMGTQRLEQALEQIAPNARILRMDADTTYSRYAYEKQFNAFARGEYDIMLGTQMIAKGLDFPNVTLVGVLNIDKLLYSGDFRSYERTFSLITQVVGRGGRGSKKGRAYIQTYSPDHYVINLAAEQNYKEFYEQETAIRKSLIYPPFCDICVVNFSSVLERNVRDGAKAFLVYMSQKVKKENVKFPLRVLGPSKCTFARINGRYRYRIIIKCRNDQIFRDFMADLIISSDKIKELEKVSVSVDINGDIGL